LNRFMRVIPLNTEAILRDETGFSLSVRRRWIGQIGPVIQHAFFAMLIGYGISSNPPDEIFAKTAYVIPRCSENVMSAY
jgi:hypothetical protein